ncbi:MAG TPA: leishmanolysin-related zinc metalloendopeptidase [Gemmatimonadales bacterium]|nr:leishmanolysin-related zinc metalloendopeptidase [Gemmatimonadales bacterium]
MPTAIVLDATALTFASLGEAQQLTPTITDEDGKTLPAETASWISSDPAVATVTQTGLVTAVGLGSAEITAEAGAASASAQVSVAQIPAAIEKISGDAQTGPAGSTLPAPLVVQVNDARGNPVPNVTVVFSVLEGDGSTSSSTALTGPDGRASTTFTTGTISGTSQVVAVTIQTTALSVSFTATAASDPTGFNIGVRFLTAATPTQRQAFTDAQQRWEAAITGDLEDGFLDIPAADCAVDAPAVSQDIDDVLILVSLVPIDGEGGTLGGAGPCYIRTVGDLTILGTMQFDTDDLEMLEAEGFLSNVILHEMGHVLGFGTLWDRQNLLVDPAEGDFPNPLADPHFIGAQAIAAFDDVGGTTYVAGAKVPVENTGGPGTADGHWRESVFDRELMTGFIGSGTSPLSIVTLSSLADQGYAIDFTKADGYTLTLALKAFDTRKQLQLKNDILRMPLRKVDSRGRVTSVLR